MVNKRHKAFTLFTGNNPASPLLVFDFETQRSVSNDCRARLIIALCQAIAEALWRAHFKAPFTIFIIGRAWWRCEQTVGAIQMVHHDHQTAPASALPPLQHSAKQSLHIAAAQKCMDPEFGF